MSNQTFTIVVEGGVVQSVQRIPDGWTYHIVDLDELETLGNWNEYCDCQELEADYRPAEYNDGDEDIVICLNCGGEVLRP